MTQRVDYTHKYIGDLYVLKQLPDYVTKAGKHSRRILAKCKCGNITTIYLQNAKHAKMCTSCKLKATNLRKNKALIGKTFDCLTVLDIVPDYISPKGSHIKRFKCKCSCGKIIVVNKCDLLQGKTKSCGHLQNTRGLLKDYPKAMAKYDYVRNKDVDLNKITAASNKKLWWKCSKCHHSWKACVRTQTRGNHNCPYCSNNKVYPGQNDLQTKFPYIVKTYWDFDKNTIQPNKVAPFSGKHAWWKCPICKHSWNAIISNVTCNNSRCAYCYQSNGEQIVFNTLMRLHVNFKAQVKLPGLKDKSSLRCDFVIYNKNNKPVYIIEYNGIQHYQPVDAFSDGISPEHAMKVTQYHDSLKMKYALKHMLGFMAITYKSNYHLDTAGQVENLVRNLRADNTII